MNTEVLGGGSFKNKVWIEQVQENLQPEIPTKLVYWDSWSTGQDAAIDFQKETAKALGLVGDESFDMIAKSVGSYVGMCVIEQTGKRVRKLIICGVPLKDFPVEEMEKRYQVLASLQAEKVICFENENDPHGSYEEVKAFLLKINPNIPIVMKTGEFNETHNYPYYQDFKKFLLG